jgi:predicted RNA binding protein YcfA (HicA-like mRNA interferase family)
MPKGVFAWSFRDIVRFLKSRGFRHIDTVGSHYHYSAVISGVDRLVQVPFHGSAALKPRTFKSIVLQSGITVREWE